MLKERRVEKGLSQSQVAEIINTNRSYVSRFETAPEHCNPTVDVIIGLSIILDLNRTEVFEYFAENREAHVEFEWFI
ncbi:helix-turn-helix domain-containing protein [Clostridium saccharoperbutylacetonicum]|uniref:helix-turn-helix domain-containing protein n=1 Tax=Clostridium saccharoperbutylacetonicum TaxID=36745 RepID=UPI0039E92AB2